MIQIGDPWIIAAHDTSRYFNTYFTPFPFVVHAYCSAVVTKYVAADSSIEYTCVAIQEPLDGPRP